MSVLTCLQWNCRGVLNKIDWIKFSPLGNADIIILQETFLKPEKEVHFPGKVIYRSDRLNRPGGGLLIAVSKTIVSYRLADINLIGDTEIMGIKIHINDLNLNLVNVYSSTGRVVADLDKFCGNIEGQMIIFGDFNLQHPNWGGTVSTGYGESFVEWIYRGNLCILNTTSCTHVAPHGAQSLIDLTFCSADIFPRATLQVDELLYDSDHHPIHISIAVDILQPVRTFYHWSNIIRGINNRLDQIQNIEYGDFVAIIAQEMERNKHNICRNRRVFPIWWTARCCNYFYQKKFLAKKARRTLSVEDWTKLKKVSAKLRRTIKEARRCYWSRVCTEASDPGILYKILKSIRNRSGSPPTSHMCLEQGDRKVVEIGNQAEVLADHFSCNGAQDCLPIAYGNDENSDLDAPFSMEELMEAIKRSKCTTPGEDGISAKIVKGLNSHSLDLLLNIYNDIWKSGVIPEGWRTAIVLPILKPGKDGRHPESYRPIALTSVLGKVCERILARRINEFLLSKKLIRDRHFGFLSFRDCQSALSVFSHDFHNARGRGERFLGVSLDLKAAYDSVYIDGLILKCAQLGITGRILRWIHNFLNDRWVKVFWHKHLSTRRCVNRGVPQGAVLSPILFTIFLSDFFDVLHSGTRGVIYADDIIIYSANESISRCRNAIQDTLRDISQWCQYWKMEVSVGKSAAFDFSRRGAECEFDFYINGGRIRWSEELKFLGFLFTRRGGLRRHVDYLRNKAFQRLNIFKVISSKNYGARSYQLLQIAMASVCSIVDHGAVNLGGMCKSLFHRLEVIGNAAIRVALGLPRWTPNMVLRKHAGVLSLEQRIKYRSLGFWIKHIALGSWSPLVDILDAGGSNRPAIPLEVEKVLDDVGGQIEGIIGFQLPQNWPNSKIRVVVSGLPFQCTNMCDDMVSSFFLDTFQSMKDSHEFIGTDATKREDKTAIAGCSVKGQFGYLVHDINSIFTAEALAMGTAVDELVSLDRPVVLITDSLSVLMALQSINIKSPRVIQWLHGKLQRIVNYIPEICLCWVPGHRGVPLNERADAIAKSVKETDVRLEWISPEDLLKNVKRRIFQDLEEKYQNSRYPSRMTNIPSVRETYAWVKSRRDDVLVTRVLCRMLVTPAILHRFRMIPDGLCGTCGVMDDMEHIIQSCRRYDSEREACFGESISSLYVCSSVDLLRSFGSSEAFRLATIKLLKLTGRF